ncbi:hypothetical protein Ciccas_002244 [Cichlidogyrus casuarinus]|uniref:receptor protein-tyrosine kinase n=1 Tax=Cichlidogyrus casuarinus TaxID=1844966 RepID=A0ABD2QHT7_9PLAT
MSYFFKRVKEINYRLSIKSSDHLTKINFIRHLDRVGALAKNNMDLVLEIVDNKNLINLWNYNGMTSRAPGSKLKVNGLTLISENPLLCPKDILSLVKQHFDPIPKESSLKLIQMFNGLDKNCGYDSLELRVSDISWTTVTISWRLKPEVFNNISTDKTISTSTVIRLSDVTQNSTIERSKEFAKRWKGTIFMCDFESSDKTAFACTYLWKGLKPGSRYAVYLDSKSSLEFGDHLSEIVFFVTKSTNPKPVELLMIENIKPDSVLVSWTKSEDNQLPSESRPFDDVRHLIWIRSLNHSTKELHDTNFCTQKNALFSQNDASNSLLPFLKSSQSENQECMKFTADCSVLNYLDNSLLQLNSQSRILNNWPSGSTVWMSDPLDLSLPVLLSPPLDERHFLYSDHIPNVVHLAVVPAQDSSQQSLNWIYIHGLRHFTRYVFEIQVCRMLKGRKAPWEELNETAANMPNAREWKEYEEEFCSERTINHQLTKMQPNSNMLDTAKIQLMVDKNDIIGAWPDLTESNGPIAYYSINFHKVADIGAYGGIERVFGRLHLDDESLNAVLESTKYPLGSNKYCLNRKEWLAIGEEMSHARNSPDRETDEFTAWLANHPPTDTLYGGFRIINIDQGIYLLKISANSFGENGTWSDPIFFEVSEVPKVLAGLTKRQLISIITILIFFLVVICSVIHLVFRLRKRWILAGRELAPNPEYWAIYEVDKWEIDFADVDPLGWRHVLGKGSFGMVYYGSLKKITTPASRYFGNCKELPVAIKTLNSDATLFDRRDFVNEACYMKQFQSHHLIALLGVVTNTRLSATSVYATNLARKIRINGRISNLVGFLRDKCSNLRWKTRSNNQTVAQDLKELSGKSSAIPAIVRNKWNAVNASSSEIEKQKKMRKSVGPLVIMELMAEGDLASYLRHLGDFDLGSVAPSQAYLWATQIADGMAYLASQKFVHRDLAARNCLLNAQLVVKIGDFGLCRDIYERNYYHKQGRARLPVRWMAPESLYSAYFTAQSDVWSYGVVLWEIATMACLPFKGMNHEEVVRFVLNGDNLLTKYTPTNCPPLLLALMIHCFSYLPKRRPTFFGLLSILAPRFSDKIFQEHSYYFVECDKSFSVLNRNVFEDLEPSQEETEALSLADVLQSLKTSQDLLDQKSPKNWVLEQNIKNLLWLGQEIELTDDPLNSGLPGANTDFSDPLHQPVIFNEAACFEYRASSSHDASTEESVYSIEQFFAATTNPGETTIKSKTVKFRSTEDDENELPL